MSQIHALTERAMVLTLSISQWQGYRLDKEASRKVVEEAGAAKDAARVNKHLVPKEALAPIGTAANAIRDHFYEKTLPWYDNGGRLLTNKLYMPFIEQHERLVSAFNDAVNHFLSVEYLRAREKAAFRMGDLFKSADYPMVSELRYRFRATLEIAPLATANDFRVQIDEAHVERVRADIEKAALERVNKAQGDMWARLAKAVGHMADKFADPDAIFRDTTIHNLAELVELIPGLNVLEDPAVEEIRLAVKAKLVGVDPKDVRKDPAYRQELAGEAKAIVEKMSGFMNAFGGAQQAA